MKQLQLKIKAQWRRLSQTQQNQILILFCAAILAGYGFWYSGLYKKISSHENMISRRENRMATREKQVIEPKNSAQAEKQIAELKKQLEADKRSLDRLSQRFVPLDNVEQQQALRRELSDLASGLGMRVVKLEGALRRSRDNNKAPSLDKMAEIDRYYGRPLLIFEAWGPYNALKSLLDDLDNLSYTVAPVKLNIFADEPKLSAHQALETKQILRIDLVLAI